MQLNFWIDAADKSLTFADGARLRVIRFGPSWISGYRDDIRYEFNRSDGTLTFAGSTSEGTATTTVTGFGQLQKCSRIDWAKWTFRGLIVKLRLQPRHASLISAVPSSGRLAKFAAKHSALSRFGRLVAKRCDAAIRRESGEKRSVRLTLETTLIDLERKWQRHQRWKESGLNREARHDF